MSWPEYVRIKSRWDYLNLANFEEIGDIVQKTSRYGFPLVQITLIDSNGTEMCSQCSN